MSIRQVQDESFEIVPRESYPRVDPMQLAGLGHEHGVQDFLRTLQKQRWTIAVWVIVLTTATALLSLRMTKIYDATARVSILSQVPTYLKFKDASSGQDDGQQQVSIDTNVRIMQSNALAMSVIQKLGLDHNPAFAGPQPKSAGEGLSAPDAAQETPAVQQGLLDKFHGNLHVQTLAGTSIIEVQFSSPDPALAAQIVNTTVSLFIEQNIKARYTSTMQAGEWLSKQLADLQIKMETSQAKLVNYQRENGIVGTDDKSNLTVEKLNELNRELTSAQSDRIQKESLYKNVVNSDPESLGATLQDAGLMGLRQQQTELKTQYARLSTQFGPSYPRVAEIKSQLDEVQKDFDTAVDNARRRVQNDYQTSLTREQLLQTALAEQTGVANQLNQSAIEYKILKQDADSNRELYDGLQQELKEASLAAGLNSSNFRVVDTASVPIHPSSPNIPRNMEFALLFGLIGGVATAFVLEGMNTSVRTPDQSESLSGLPTMGVIPQNLLDAAALREAAARLAKIAAPRTLRPEFLVSYLRPLSEVAEAYKALRTSILLSAANNPPQIILLTSAMPQDGKTTTSANLAVVMAQQSKRVLLIDADLRRPTLHKAFGSCSDAGLSNLLSGAEAEGELIQPTLQPNLFLLPAGPIPPHAAELLGSARMQELISQWRQKYDHIIIDTPPVLSVTDAVMLSTLADGVILVIRAGKTKAAALRRASDLLMHEGINLLGTVVNAADLSSPDYYYYGLGYGSYYRDIKTAALRDPVSHVDEHSELPDR